LPLAIHKSGNPRPRHSAKNSLSFPKQY